MSARIRTAVKVLKEEIKKFEKIQQDESKKVCGPCFRHGTLVERVIDACIERQK